MIKNSIEQFSEAIGFDIGTSDNITQANLINGLCRGMANSMDESNLGTQLCHIVDKLDPKSHKVLKELAAFIELKEKK